MRGAVKRFFFPYRYDVIVFDTDTGREITMLKSSFRHWYADPFLFSVSSQENPSLFVELMRTTHKRGEIAVFDFERKKFDIVLSEPFHLSFPNLFAINGTIYMIPESSAINEIRLYQCDEFPKKWRFVKTIRGDVDSVDNVVFKIRDRWFLGAYERNQKPFSLCLYPFDVNALEIEERPIARFPDPNKVLRPAGNPFWESGQLIFPTQKGTSSYGEDILFNQIVEQEGSLNIIPLSNTPPLPNRLRRYGHKHTYNRLQAQNLACVDAAKQHFSLFQGVYGLRASLRIRKK